MSFRSKLTLGGVATGKQKAQEHANAVGIMNVYGLTLDPTAIDADIGIMIDDVAVFDVTQVIQLIAKTTKNTWIGNDTFIEPNMFPK